MAISDLSRFEQFLATPVEDVENRSKLALTVAEAKELHSLAIQGQISWDFYRHANTAMKADFLFRNGLSEKGWIIATIRNQLNRVQVRTFTQGDESIQETISNHCWPFFKHIRRTRQGPDTTIEEVELVFSPREKPAQLFENYEPGFGEEAMLLLQAHYENEQVKEVAFLPARGHEYWIILSCGEAKKKFQFPVALRYSNLLHKFTKMYPLEDTEFQSNSTSGATIQQHASFELGEGLLGLWVAIRDYDPHEVKHIPGYIELHVKWHMQDQQKAHSTEVGAEFRDPANKLILNERLERSGGELDAPLPRTGDTNGESDSQAVSLRDTLTIDRLGPVDQLMADEHAYYRKIMSYLPDPIDRKIVWGLVAMGSTQMELAQELSMSQSAVAQRVAKIRPIVRAILAS